MSHISNTIRNNCLQYPMAEEAADEIDALEKQLADFVKAVPVLDIDAAVSALELFSRQQTGDVSVNALNACSRLRQFLSLARSLQ